jgi:hypothetical protein
MFLLLDGDGGFAEQQFLPLQLLDLRLHPVRPAEVLPLDAQRLVGLQQLHHFADLLRVQILLVLERAQPSQEHC